MTMAYSRLPLVHAAAGHYCAADPDDPAITTAWRVTDGGALYRYPVGHRWEPTCPTFDDIADLDARRSARDDWYVTVYFTWKTKIVEQINADPAAAAVAFARRYPQELVRQALEAQAKARREKWDRLHAERRHAEALLAVLLVRRGRSIRSVAAILGVARSTARERIAAGRPAWDADPAAARAALVAYQTSVMDRTDVEDLVERLLAGPAVTPAEWAATLSTSRFGADLNRDDRPGPAADA
jgi:hypothetical protein